MAWTSDLRPGWRPSRLEGLWRHHQVEIWWWVFVAANAWGIMMLRAWATIPFHFIWIGLSLMYGWRVWRLRATAAALGVIVVLTGATLLVDVLSGDQQADELTEIPLMAAVAVTMVYFVRRSVAAQRETERVSERNLALLEDSRQLVQDASHVLRTPLTIAIGHAELLHRTTVDPAAAEDSQVVIDELQRLKKTTDRLLALAKSEQPDFLFPVETSLAQLVAGTTRRWTATHPHVVLGRLEDVVASLDPDRVSEALDEMIGNAVTHCRQGTPIEVWARRAAKFVVVAVTDHGPGVPAELRSGLFKRFVHGTESGHHGAGLGLAIVRAVSESHGGTAFWYPRPGGGSVFGMRLPLAARELAETVPETVPEAERLSEGSALESGA